MTASRFFGDRNFYRRVITVVTPILIQNVITNFVSLLDNIMVGQVGTEPMSGVAIVNQLLFVFNLCVFGGISGAGIFTAQFFGKDDHEGVRDTFRAKYYIALAAVIIFFAVFALFGENLIGLFLHEGKEQLDLAATLGYGRDYLHIMMLEMLPFAITQVYSGTLRETNETMLPMKAGIAAVFVNLIFNYILIFGKLGAPALGVVGAAIATVISRFVECTIVIIWTHTHAKKNRFIIGAYRSFRVPGALVHRMIRLGSPLLINEVLWAAGVAMLNQSYSIRGLEVVSAVNICSTVSNLFFCAFLSMGNAIAIIIGQLLGQGDYDRAVDEDRKLIIFAVLTCTGIGIIMAVLAPIIPNIYNTSEAVRGIAARLLLVSAAMMPVNAFTNACYFTLRSGGKTIITFIFDSAFLWVISVPAAFALSRLTEMPMLSMYICVQALDLIKCAIGFVLVKNRKWVNNIVASEG